MSDANLIFVFVMFVLLLTFLGGLYGSAVISGSVNPKFSWNPIEIIKSFLALTKISTGYKFLSFLIIAIIAAVIFILLKLLSQVIPKVLPIPI